MKTVIEYYLSIMLLLLALLFTLETFQNIYNLHQAHHCRDAVVFMIDSYDEYSDVVKEQIMKQNTCSAHPFIVKMDQSRYLIDVEYTLKYRILGVNKKIHLKSFSNMVF